MMLIITVTHKKLLQMMRSKACELEIDAKNNVQQGEIITVKSYKTYEETRFKVVMIICLGFDTQSLFLKVA